MSYIPIKYRLDMLDSETACKMLCGGCSWWNDDRSICDKSYTNSQIPTNILVGVMNELI